MERTANLSTPAGSTVLFAAVLMALAALPVPAAACSIGYERGSSPEEVMDRRDVHVFRGTFRFVEVIGEQGVNEEGEEILLSPEVHGVLERGATHWETVSIPIRQFADGTCLLPATGPSADARGTFWITERREQGRYRILHWEGEYLSEVQVEAEPTP